MVSPTNVAPTRPRPKAVATPKLTAKGTAAPTTALGEQCDRLAGLDQAEDRRADQHADDQLPHHRRQAERAQRDRHQPDAGEQDEQIESDFVHVPLSPCAERNSGSAIEQAPAGDVIMRRC
jgi:hypothetical protein